MAELVQYMDVAGNGAMIAVAIFLTTHEVKIKNLEREVFK